MAIPGLAIIGERINPSFKSVNAFFDNRDMKGIQELAVKQANAGAAFIDITTGNRALKDHDLTREVIRAVQDAVDVPICFDFEDAVVQETCLKTYDATKAKGRWPLVNSVSETRWETMELQKIQPFKVIFMASERLEGGAAKPNRTAEEIADTAARVAEKSAAQYGLKLDDMYMDISIRSLATDTTGVTKTTLDAVKLIGANPKLKGSHMVGGLSNVGNMLPSKTESGLELRTELECAFLTVAMPHGFDTVIGTPWKNYHLLPEGDRVLQVFRETIELKGSAALRHLRQLYRG